MVESSTSAHSKAKLLEGNWKKVSEEGQDKAMLQLGLNVVFRKAAKLLSKLEIKASPELEIVTRGAMIVSIKERYDYSGKECKNSRRDQNAGRFGKHTGKVRRSPTSLCPTITTRKNF